MRHLAQICAFLGRFRSRLPLLAALLCLLTPGCKRLGITQDDKSKEGGTVVLKLVHDPLIRQYIQHISAAFAEDKPTISGGRRVVLELIEAPALAASKNLASGKLKVDAWMAPSRTWVEFTNAHLVNLGAGQVDCRQLFGSPYVLATRRDNILELGAQAQLAWPYVMSQEPRAEGERRIPALMHTQPLKSATGLGALVQLAYLAVPQGAKALSAADFEANAGFEKLREMENLASNYGEDEQSLLNVAAAQSGTFRRFVLTTEQQMVQYNLAHPGDAPLTAVYLSEGSLWQDYAVCRSQADWVTPDRRVALKLLSDFMSSLPAQQEISGMGFRPAARDLPGAYPLARELGVRPDLPKKSFPPPDGRLTAKLLARWPQLQRPLAVAFVLDASGSMEGDALNIMRQSIGGLLDRLAERDLAALISFSTRAEVRASFTTDHTKVAAQLAQLEAGGGSALYDAVNLALQMINQEDLKDFRKHLVVIVDGPDRNSEIALPLLSGAIKNTTARQDIDFTVIGIAGQGLQPEALSEIIQAGHGVLKTAAPQQLHETSEEIWRNL